ncbi:ATPase [Desulfofundulus sp.]|uniref:ATPase n=1 Tax=Desulfofundulus sp. TaxID=2282750 RepID=UPI003C780AF8
MELFHILNEMEEMIENSPRIPMTRRVMVDEDRLLDYLDRIRTTLPEELRQARWLLQEREKVLADTRKEAGRLLEDAQKQLERRAEESEVVRKAQAMADEIVHKAEQVAREIKQGAREYADEILGGLEVELEKIMTQIRNGRAELRGVKVTDGVNSRAAQG